MYSVSNTTAKWDLSAAYENAVNQTTDAFSLLMERLKNKGSSTQESLVDLLSQRFPTLRFTTPEAANETAESDQVVVESDAAEALAGNASMREMLEKALAAFAESAGRVQPLEGASVQRSMTVTTISIRISVNHVSTNSSEVVASNELKAAFSERLEEMIRKYFGMGSASDEDEEKAGDEAAVASAEAAGRRDSSSFWAAGVSFSMYFSASYISTKGIAGGDDSIILSNRWSAQFTYEGAGFQGLASDFFPYAIFSGLQSAGFGSGPFTSMLDAAMEQFGLTTENMWQQNGGYFLKLRESRNLIAELMNAYSGNGTSVPKETEEETVQEAAGV